MLDLYFDNLWRWKCGLPENEYGKPITFEELQQTEWDVDFEKLMRNRLIMGATRYGRIGAKNKPKYDRINSMIKRLTKFQESGNKEFLVDVANLCLLEFVECNHPNQHFHAIDDGEHVAALNVI
jgi:dihydrofolate reductase